MTAYIDSPLLCHECPKSFENKKTLTDHLLTHPKTKKNVISVENFIKTERG